MRAGTLLLVAGLCACGSNVARPVADPGELTRTGKAGTALAFDASKSTGAIDKYQWSFGDDSPSEEGVQVSHAWAVDGDYTVTLTVRGPGGFSSASVQVSIGQACTATAAISVVTADPQPAVPVLLSSAGSTGCMGAAIAQYQWDFGDGMVDSGPAKASVTHTWAAKGSYQVKLKVVDLSGAEGQATRTLGVGVAASGDPMITCPATVTGEAGRALSFAAAGSDPQGQTLSWAWTFSDGGAATGSAVQHTFASPGSYTAQVVATATDARASMPCTTNVTVTAPVSYTGTWLLNPTSGAGLTGCPYGVTFPAATLSLLHNGSQLNISPSGAAWPSGQYLLGMQDPPPDLTTFRANNTLPSETRPGCGLSTRDDSVRLTFTSATTLTGHWTILYGGTLGTCTCNASGDFTGIKQ